MMGIVCLVDIYCDTVRRIGELRHGIHDQPIIFFTIIGGYDIKTISDPEKSSHIVLVGKCIILRNIFFAELASHRFQLILIFRIYC